MSSSHRNLQPDTDPTGGISTVPDIFDSTSGPESSVESLDGAGSRELCVTGGVRGGGGVCGGGGGEKLRQIVHKVREGVLTNLAADLRTTMMMS